MPVSIFQIPVTPSQPQNFTVGLGTTVYGMTIQWRETMAQCWVLDLKDNAGAVLLAGVPLLPGANLLAQYPDLDFPGELWVASEGTDAPPTYDNLGVNSHLYYVERT